MLFNNIGTIQWRIVLAFIAGMFAAAVLVQTIFAAQIFPPLTSHKIAVPIPPDNPNSLQHDFLAAMINE